MNPSSATEAPDDDDVEWVATALGRRPRSAFAVAARDAQGRVAVIRNPPFLDDGTPMPTTFWLVDPELTRRIGTLEAGGGVNRAESEVGLAAIDEAHRRYAAERDREVPTGHTGPRPAHGVGGTRRGVKCLHAHFAWHLAGGDDPVGRWIDAELQRGETVG